MPTSWQSTQENKAVNDYLTYLTTGQLPTPPNIDTKMEVLDAKIANETRLFIKVQLLQEKRDLTTPTITEADLIEAFVKHAGGFSERNGIAYVTWREMGVPAAVLTQAGLKAASTSKARSRPYHPRRLWTAEEKAEYIAFYEAEGREATCERYGGTVGATAQRFYGFRAEANKAAGNPPNKPGRPPTKRDA